MMDYAEAAAAAREFPGRCVLFARHGQRPSIEPNDPTYGRLLPLTPEGEALARACGKALRAAGTPSEWTFGASSLRRTLLTAQYVAEEIGADPTCVSATPEVGIPGLWIDDLPTVFAHQKRLGIQTYHDRQARDGFIPGFAPSEVSAQRVLQWLAAPTTLSTRLAFFSTHDCHLAALLNALAIANIDAQHWVGFLQGCALFFHPDGSIRAHYLVPNKATYSTPFFQ